MAIVPDSKDWTWVLERRCPECGFVSAELPRDQIAPMIRTNAVAWKDILADDPVRLRLREHDDRWSRLEYACHVRDVFRIFDERLHLMVTSDDPTFQNWDQDRTAVEDRYGDQDPQTVGVELSEAGAALASSFDQVEAAAWERLGTRSDGAHFTVMTIGRYALHDVVHHLHDVAGSSATPAS
ncbi:MAG: DinB family protein [Acidimicrobiales bacterium]|jgi:hypothetical protein